MKVGITSCGPGLNDKVDARLGRCPCFVLVDTETMEFETIPNPYMTMGSGTGIQSAQLMAEKGVTVMLTGNCGPNAFHVFRAAGIHVISGVDGIVQDAVQQFKSHKLVSSFRPNVQNHFGMRELATLRHMKKIRGELRNDIRLIRLWKAPSTEQHL